MLQKMRVFLCAFSWGSFESECKLLKYCNSLLHWQTNDIFHQRINDNHAFALPSFGVLG